MAGLRLPLILLVLLSISFALCDIAILVILISFVMCQAAGAQFPDDESLQQRSRTHSPPFPIGRSAAGIGMVPGEFGIVRELCRRVALQFPADRGAVDAEFACNHRRAAALL